MMPVHMTIAIAAENTFLTTHCSIIGGIIECFFRDSGIENKKYLSG
jgi:hypothetical protein